MPRYDTHVESSTNHDAFQGPSDIQPGDSHGDDFYPTVGTIGVLTWFLKQDTKHFVVAIIIILLAILTFVGTGVFQKSAGSLDDHNESTSDLTTSWIWMFMWFAPSIPLVMLVMILMASWKEHEEALMGLPLVNVVMIIVQGYYVSRLVVYYDEYTDTDAPCDDPTSDNIDNCEGLKTGFNITLSGIILISVMQFVQIVTCWVRATRIRHKRRTSDFMYQNMVGAGATLA
eukprot:GFYU01003053.1.p1 GENE.GFYU01003053.1~~GFYU01003053.1.p1  ORF type:complete len:230 (+),score=30.24 GFYU01003053.1:98-787(+)